MSTFRNLLQNAMRRKNLLVMADKLVAHVRESQRGDNEVTSLRWCEQHQVPIEDFAQALDADLWREAVKFAEDFAVRGKQILSTSPVKLGGRGAYHLLYFLTRLRRPRVVLETGVAAGWSSAAFLHALKINNDGGKLYSSDFPYFRQNEPEKSIGILVDDDLKDNWQLNIDGDKINLPRMLRQVEKVDIFHYDSDKTYSGREFGLRAVTPKLSDDGIVIFDDIQQNTHFKNWVDQAGKHYYVFQYSGNYLGLVTM